MSADDVINAVKEHFGPEFPISTGTAQPANPLVITEEVDYVSIEYAVANYILRSMWRYRYKLKEQSTSHIDGRVIDKMIFLANRGGTEEKTFYFAFDITAGFNHSND